jgi:hypothetical protein
MDEEVEVGVRTGRKQGLFLPLDDVAYFLKTTTPPRSALTQGSVRDDGSVAQAATPRSGPRRCETTRLTL